MLCRPGVTIPLLAGILTPSILYRRYYGLV